MATTGNLEKLGAVEKYRPLTTRRFFSGLFTNRSPLNQPGDGSSTRYYDAFAGGKSDALIDGLNMEVSNKNTLVTRPGFGLFATPNVGEAALGVHSAVMPGSTKLLYDQFTNVYNGAQPIYLKVVPGNRTRFLTVGQETFMSCPGTAVSPDRPRVWDGASTNVDYLGIDAPALAPTLTLNAGSGMHASSGWRYVYCYANPKYGHVSTASPISASTGTGTWGSITISGPRDSFDNGKIQIYRTADGGGQYMFVAEIDNPPSGNFSYTDTAQDSALNPFILAPQNGANDRPLNQTGAYSGFAYYAGRLWGAVDNTLYYSGGPDTTNGNGLMAWPPSNFFIFPDKVNRLVPYANGLLVFTVRDIYAIFGTTKANFYPKLQQAGLGVATYDCVDVNGFEIYAFTHRRQFIMINPGAGIVDVGFPIGDKLATFNPSSVFVTFQSFGGDEAVYVSNGVDSIYRMNAHQYPEGNICWSPKAQPVGGVRWMGAVYDTANNLSLLIINSAGSAVLKRTNVAQDNGSNYSGSAIIGPIVLAMPGEIADANAISIESSSGTRPTVYVLQNEISGTFPTLADFVPDPPELPAFSSYHSDMYYLAQTTSGPTRQLQLALEFPADGQGHEVYGYSVYGKLDKR